LAAYKSFDDYHLFEEGYVKYLLTKTLLNEGIHVFMGKVQPAMKKKTMKGNTVRICILFWKGEAKCLCKGGYDSGCKHIAAAMYLLKDLLHMWGSGVTQGCQGVQ
jgi:hypothetical protein